MSVIVKRLGYGGSGEIDGSQVLITSGSFEEGMSISHLNMIHTPPTNKFVGRVKHADGTVGYSGSIAFDIDDVTSSLFTIGKLLGRGYKFSVGVHDGESGRVMKDCFASSVTVSGGVGGIVGGNVSFTSSKAPVGGSVANNFIRGRKPVGYWLTGDGSNHIKEWGLTMSQDLSVEYFNEDSIEPGYLKFGLVHYSLSLSSYEEMNIGDSFNISIPHGVTLKGEVTGRSFSYGGLTELGEYSYEFETSSQKGRAGDLVIS